jgi:hypothetical protein
MHYTFISSFLKVPEKVARNYTVYEKYVTGSVTPFPMVWPSEWNVPYAVACIF